MRLRRMAVIAVAGVVVAATVGASGITVDPTVELRPGRPSVNAGMTVQLHIVVPDAEGGVGRYDLTVEVQRPEVASVVGGQDQTGGVGEVTVRDREARFDFERGDTQDDFAVTIATVTLRGTGDGRTDVVLRVRELRKESGREYRDVTTRPALLTVEGETPTASPSPTPDGAPTETPEDGPDPDGDGEAAIDPDRDVLHEDVNGDGDVTPGDATVLFNAIFENDPEVYNNVLLFDFNDDGELTPADATVLFNEAFA